MPERTASHISTSMIGNMPGCPTFSDLLLLTKARVNVFVVGTAFVGFALNASILSNWLLLIHALIGTGFIAGAAAAANQMLEYKFDRKMNRTRNRPLAADRLRRRTAFLVTGTLFGLGCIWLGSAVNFPALFLASLSFAIYVFVYTPLKRRTPFCTLFGAIAGALPVLVGWAATEAAFGRWTAAAFGVLFLWQIPHFLAIAWWRQSDYIGAGFRVLPRDDQQGYRTAGWSVAFTAAMMFVSLAPAFPNGIEYWYLAGGFGLGSTMLFSSIQFLRKRNEAAARSLFISSLFYLSCLYLLMLLIPAHK